MTSNNPSVKRHRKTRNPYSGPGLESQSGDSDNETVPTVEDADLDPIMPEDVPLDIRAKPSPIADCFGCYCLFGPQRIPGQDPICDSLWNTYLQNLSSLNITQLCQTLHEEHNRLVFEPSILDVTAVPELRREWTTEMIEKHLTQHMGDDKLRLRLASDTLYALVDKNSKCAYSINPDTKVEKPNVRVQALNLASMRMMMIMAKAKT